MEKEYFERVELVNASDPLSAIRFNHPGKSFELGSGYVLTPYDVIGMSTPAFWMNNNRFTMPYVRVWWQGIPLVLYDKSATSEYEAVVSGLVTVSKDGQREFIVKELYGKFIYIDVKESVIIHEKIPGPEISEDEFWNEVYRGSDELREEIRQLGRKDPMLRMQWDKRINPLGPLVPRKGVTNEEFNEWLEQDYYVEAYTHS